MPYAPSEKSLCDAEGNKIPWMGMTGNDHPISRELADAVAGVVIEWGSFENGIVLDTSQLMQYPTVRALTDSAPRSFKQKIELWKRAIHTLYPKIPPYIEAADEICSKGKIIAQHRHRLIHGRWMPPKGDGSEYEVLIVKGLETVEKFEHILATVEYVTAVRNDIKSLDDALMGFLVNRMWHAHLGLLKATPVPKP